MEKPFAPVSAARAGRVATPLFIAGTALLVILFSVSYRHMSAQAPSDTGEPGRFRSPVGTGRLYESQDLRLFLFDRATVHDRVARGVVCIVPADVRFAALADSAPTEYSTNECLQVKDALRRLGILERSRHRRQVRVIQRDAILQSSVDVASGPKDGYSKEFLERKLSPGDVLVLTLYD